MADIKFIELKADVSKKVPGQKKQEKIGEMVYYVPTLEDAGLSGMERQKDDEGKDLINDETGLPAYKAKEHNWVQNAIHAAVKAQARNKLVSQTANLKEGAKIATDWDELTAEAPGGGGGEALKAMHEVKDLFKKHVQSLGKSQKAQDTLNTLFSNPASLALQSEENRGKMEAYVTEFAATLDEAKLARYSKYLEKISAACSTEEEAEDF